MNNDDFYMNIAYKNALKCTNVNSAYNVGCVIVKDDKIISSSYSREYDGNTHAEENAINIAINIPNNCTLYTTMEPCSHRLSGKKSCCDRIIENNKIKRVVIGDLEPPIFVKCNGIEILKKNKIEVCHLTNWKHRNILNKHL